jgi:hypothetical protein
MMSHGTCSLVVFPKCFLVGHICFLAGHMIIIYDEPKKYSTVLAKKRSNKQLKSSQFVEEGSPILWPVIAPT